MANTVFKLRRSSVAGKVPNTSTLAIGELGLNLTDRKLYSSDGTNVWETGANLSSVSVGNSSSVFFAVNATGVYTNNDILITKNDKSLKFATVNTSAYSYFTQQSDDNFVFYTTNASYGVRPVWSIYANNSSSPISFSVAVQLNNWINLNSQAVYANGSSGTAGQVLTSNGSATYWSTSSGGGGSVNTAAQYVWTNTHTFSANVSFNSPIGLATNTAIYFNGTGDANWRIARNSNTLTKWIYTNNTIDIITANSTNEGFAIGLVANATYFETGYLGTYIANKIVVGSASSNATINSTTFTGTANNSLYLGGTIASGYQTTAGLSDNVATLTSNNTSFVGSVSAANVVSNAQLLANLSGYVTTTNLTNNLANYQTTAGLSANVATLTANNTSFVGSVTAANVVSNAQLSANLTNYALLSGATFTGNVVANNANTIYDLNVGRNLTVAGNLTITGNVTVIGANNLSIVDNFIYLNSNNTTQNIDIGFAANYNDGTYHHTGFFRDATDGIYKVFDNYGPEPDANVNIDTTNTTFHLANFQANTYYAGNTSTNWAVINTAGIYTTGVVNAASHIVGSSFSVNTSVINIGSLGVYANGSFGTASQVLTSNGSATYWSTTSGANTTVVNVRQQYTGDGACTVFTVSSGYVANTLSVYINGVLLRNGVDVDVSSGGTFTITPAPESGAYIDAVGMVASPLTTSNIPVSQLFTGDGSTTSFTVTGGYVVGTISVYVNGVKYSSSDVTTSSGSVILFGTAPPNGAIIEVMGVAPVATLNSPVRQSFTGDGVTTSFTVTGGYVANNLDVYGNGVKYSSSEVTTSSGSVILFGTAPPNGAIIDVVGFINGVTATYNTQVRQNFTGDGSTTSFTVSGGYTPNYIDVYMNGIRLTSSEVTTTSGSTINMTTAPPIGAVIDVVGYQVSSMISVDTSMSYTWSATQTYTANIVANNVYVNTINSSSYSVGSSTIANSTGVYTGIVNAASHTVGSSTIANSTGVYTGIVNGSTISVGTSFTANSTVVNAVSYNVGSTIVANSTGTYDSLGNLRSIPVQGKTASYTLTSTDNGTTISSNAGVTVNGAVIAANQVFTIFNNSAASITITQGTGATMYLAGSTTTGNRTLANYGVATLLCVAANTFVISGAGLT